MSIGRFLKCRKCGFDNQLSKLNCEKCSAILRDKVPNIDFVKTVLMLIENPNAGFKTIINAEHKNYIIVLSLAFTLKLFLLYYSVSILINSTVSSFFTASIFFISLAFITFLIIPIFLKIVFNTIKIKNRYKDYLAVIAYSNHPIMISLILFSILELSVFGGYLFNYEPNIFDIKPFFAYFFLVLEFIMLLWAFINTIIALNYFLKNIIVALLMGGLVFSTLILLPSFLYFVLNQFLI